MKRERPEGGAHRPLASDHQDGSNVPGRSAPAIVLAEEADAA